VRWTSQVRRKYYVRWFVDIEVVSVFRCKLQKPMYMRVCGGPRKAKLIYFSASGAQHEAVSQRTYIGWRPTCLSNMHLELRLIWHLVPSATEVTVPSESGADRQASTAGTVFDVFQTLLASCADDLFHVPGFRLQTCGGGASGNTIFDLCGSRLMQRRCPEFAVDIWSEDSIYRFERRIY